MTISTSIERDWRAFEQIADGTVFQSFDWVSLWHQHIGRREGVRPVVVTGRDSAGQLLFLLPLSIERGGLARRLTWLGTTLCDYNGPLLAPEFGAQVDAARFRDVWSEILGRLQSHPDFGFDVVHFDKMQRTVGPQPNPFIGLGVIPHANGAYLTKLGTDWESFYADKRSSSTRRRDRTKRKKLGEFGEVKFVTAEGDERAEATLETLMDQKSKSFAAMGVTNIFALPGYSDFYHALSRMSGFVHVSRLDVGNEVAAANLGLIFRGSYYHLLASYNGGESVEVRAWRGASARSPALRHGARPARRSTSPSATSATSRNGATATSCCSTISRRRRCGARSPRRSSMPSDAPSTSSSRTRRCGRRPTRFAPSSAR